MYNFGFGGTEFAVDVVTIECNHIEKKFKGVPN